MTLPRLAVVVSGFPRRSETFALNELVALETHGMLAAVFATKPGEVLPEEAAVQRLMPFVQFLPPGSPAEQAAALAAALPHSGASGVHAYFAHVPAEVAECAAAGANLPFGFSMHARDARKVSRAVLGARAAHAACVIACNTDVASELPDPSRATLVPHGVDIGRFAPQHAEPGPSLRLLAVGRLVEKKGFDILIDALVRVDGATLRLVGDGPERDQLERRARDLGLGDRVRFVGGLSNADLPAEYTQADVVVVPSVVDRTGDRDGLPNVVLEAMACARPVVGTRVGAIAAALTHGMTGLLVPPRAPDALARAIRRLAEHPAERAAMGRAARRVVSMEFSLERAGERFCAAMEAAYA